MCGFCVTYDAVLYGLLLVFLLLLCVLLLFINGFVWLFVGYGVMLYGVRVF